MNRVQRLSPIVELAENKEKQAAQALGQSQQKLDAVRKSLQSLVSFRQNYAAQFHQSGNQGLGVRQLHEYRAFLNKINLAIADQEKAFAQAEESLRHSRQLWEEAHRHSLGMHKMVDKLRWEQEQKDQKREQNEQDERASRKGSNGGKTLLSLFI